MLHGGDRWSRPNGWEIPAFLLTTRLLRKPTPPILLVGTHISQTQIRRQITDQFIEALKAGGIPPWRKGWACHGGGMPANVVSRGRYSGVNVLLLQNLPRWRWPPELRRAPKKARTPRTQGLSPASWTVCWRNCVRRSWRRFRGSWGRRSRRLRFSVLSSQVLVSSFQFPSVGAAAGPLTPISDSASSLPALLEAGSLFRSVVPTLRKARRVGQPSYN